MKKHSILFLALLTAVSCQKENTQDIAPVVDSNVELRASFDEQSSRIATEDGLTFSLEEGKEQIGVYIQNDGMNALENVLYTAGSADEQGWIAFSTQVPVHVQSNSKFFAYAPYSATTVDVSGSTDDSVIEPAAAGSGWNGKRAINLPDLQEQPAAGVKTDIAKYYSVVAAPATPVARDVLESYSVNLQFSGVFALVRFGLNNFTEGEIKVSKIVFSAENAALTGYFSVDLTHENPKLANTEYAPEAVAGKTFDKVTVTLAEPATIQPQKMAEVYAVVNACAVTAPKLTVYATDAEGKDIVFEKTLSDKTFSRQQRTAIGVKLENPVVADYAQEVIDALKNGGTVKIEKNVDLSGKGNIEIPAGTTVDLEIPAGIEVVLGENTILNNGSTTISGNGTITATDSVITNCANAELKIDGGTFVTTSFLKKTSAIRNEEGGILTINDCNVDAVHHAVTNFGTMTLHGGNIASSSSNQNKDEAGTSYYAYAVVSSGENAFITIDSDNVIINGIQGALSITNKSKAEISGGIFSTYAPNNFYGLYVAMDGEAMISGGHFYAEGNNKNCVFIGNEDIVTATFGKPVLCGGYYSNQGYSGKTGTALKPAKGYKWVELAEPLVITNEINGKTNTYYYQIVEGEDLGYKEVEGGYEIYSAKGLQWLAEQVNGGNNFSGKTVTLTADIDLSGIEWTPIGTKDAPFAGTFDGGSKTISNLNVNSPEEAFKGLFGRLVDPGTISNVNIDNATVKGLSQVGAIVGSAYTGSVSNCHVSGDIAIEGNYQVGGIAGNGYATISDCSVIGNAGSYVKGTYKENNLEGDAVGGIIGYACEEHTENDVISGCSATIDVSGTRKVGGIAGQCGHTANLGSCTFSGNVATNADETYIAGNAGKIMVGGLVGELTNDGGTPALCALYIRNCTVASGSTVTGVDAKTTGAILGGSRTAGYTLNEENNTATGVTVTPSNELPEGIVKTETGYEIQSATGLSNLAALVNEGKDFAGETIVLADNMNLEGIAWTPIGNCSRSETTGAAFRGTFDGNNKVISNLNCALDADGFGAGLFGLLDGATVRNITVDSGEISNSKDCAGAICGVMVGESVIENCHNTGATISAKGAAGGIVGRAYGTSNTITGCTNSAQVSGTQKVGGIVGITGTNGTTLIDNCNNSGSVSGGNAGVGGIAGYVGQPTTVKNCTNTGTVGIATDKYAAGIVGYHQTTPSCDIENCNNEGAITAINAGGIFGCVGSTQATNISGCENHGDVTGVNIAGGISAGTSSGTLENCKNTANITASAEGGIAGGIAGQYRNAAIVNCAGGAASAAVTAQYAGRIIGLALNGTVFANNMPEDARLTLDDSNGDDYSGISSIGAMGMYTSGGSIIIAGGTLHGLPVQAVELSHIRIEEGAAWDVYPNETGIWTSDKTRPWGREGLIETTDGYDITNTYGILHFAQMVNNGVSTFSGKTILLKNNLNLGGEEWMPIGNGSRYKQTYTGNAFKGTFDGNGKTISGLKINERSGKAAAGLIGVLDGGTVKNVTLEVDIDVASKANELAAGCVGLLTNNGLVENVTVSGSVKSGETAAGIVSRVIKSGTVRNCHNHATINGTSYNIGGIVGAAYYDNEGMAIEGCTNDGAISGTNAVGGIAGLSAAEVKNCSNSATVTGNGTSVGGVIGEQQNAGSVTGCTNTGNIINIKAEYGNGGIVGWIRYSGGTTNYPHMNIITVSGCENRGSVSGGNDAGGIVGTVYNHGVIDNNKNYAPTLSAKTFVAGVVGNVQFDTTADGIAEEQHVYVTDNYSETTLEDMTGGLKSKFVYINNSDKTTSSGNTPDNN